jgi:hypothetical protein
VEAKGLEPSNLLTASQALYQLSYAPVAIAFRSRMVNLAATLRTLPAVCHARNSMAMRSVTPRRSTV